MAILFLQGQVCRSGLQRVVKSGDVSCQADFQSGKDDKDAPLSPRSAQLLLCFSSEVGDGRPVVAIYGGEQVTSVVEPEP